LEINIHSYDLPDADILVSPNEFEYSVWRPDKLYVILGRANNASSSLWLENIINDKVDVYKRPSGGETVILSPNMAVFSAKMKFDKSMSTKQVFSKINSLLIRHLSDLGIHDLNTRGISDISIGSRKIVGSSMYLNKNVIFYHAVLNISEDVSLISKYLKHPTREPDYRMGRSHLEFVTSLQNEGYDIDYSIVAQKLTLALQELQ
jgi:lipoate-protein ligase A